MMVDKTTAQGSLYRAATTAFDFNNPPESLAELLRLATEILHADSAALYEFDGSDYRLLSEPKLALPGEGTADIELGSLAGKTFKFSVTPIVAAR